MKLASYEGGQIVVIAEGNEERALVESYLPLRLREHDGTTFWFRKDRMGDPTRSRQMREHSIGCFKTSTQYKDVIRKFSLTEVQATPGRPGELILTLPKQLDLLDKPNRLRPRVVKPSNGVEEKLRETTARLNDLLANADGVTARIESGQVVLYKQTLRKLR